MNKHTVPLPIDQVVRWPVECVGCGAAAGELTAAVPVYNQPVSWLYPWSWFRSPWRYGNMKLAPITEVNVPACGRCRRAISIRNWFCMWGIWLVLYLAGTAFAVAFRDSTLDAQEWLVLVWVSLCVLLHAMVERGYPVAVFGNSQRLRYMFRSAQLAGRFAQLNEVP